MGCRCSEGAVWYVAKLEAGDAARGYAHAARENARGLGAGVESGYGWRCRGRSCDGPGWNVGRRRRGVALDGEGKTRFDVGTGGDVPGKAGTRDLCAARDRRTTQPGQEEDLQGLGDPDGSGGWIP